MLKSWSELISVADRNSRTSAQKVEEEERRKREKLKPKNEQNRNVDQEAIQKILERRRREAHQEKLLELKRKKLAEEQRLKKAAEARIQQAASSSKSVSSNSNKSKSNVNAPVKSKGNAPPPPRPPPPPPSRSSQIKKPTISYEDLMRYASLKANNQPIPKELAHVAQSLRDNKTTSSTEKSATITKNGASNSKVSTSSLTKKPVSSSSSSTSVGKSSSTSAKTIRTSAPPISNGTTHRPVTSSVAKTRPMAPPPAPRPSSSFTRPVSNNRSSFPINGRRLAPKRPMIDTDDEEDEEDETMKDFIVDDDDENNNQFDYRKELHDTLKKNFGFDHQKYRRRVLDDDEDDLRNMESSFDQIQREEVYSAKMGLKEDVDDILREEAEKRKKELMKKRPKLSTK